MSAPDIASHPATQALVNRHRLRWWEPIPWILAIGFFFVFPRHLGFGNEMLVMVLFALSLDLVLGYAGIVTLGHAAFFGIGALHRRHAGAARHLDRAIERLVDCGGRGGRVRSSVRLRASAHHRLDAADADAVHHAVA